jgi:PrcB C-terminal
VAARRHRDLALAFVTAAAVFATFWPLYEHLVRHGGSRPYPWEDVTARIRPLPLARPSGHLFHSQRDLTRYIRSAVPGRRAARIPLKGREALLVAAGPRSSTGYRVSILSVTEQRSRIIVRARERTPDLDDTVQPVVTSPYRLISFHASEKPVFLDWVGR